MAGIASHIAALGDMDQALEVVADIPHGNHRSDALTGIVSSISLEQPELVICPLIVTMLVEFSRLSRREFLEGIESLAPVIGNLGGETALIDVFRSVKDVGRWWP